MMVKTLDDSDEAAIDHIGLWLWRAAMDWRGRMRAEMAVRGYPWHSEARGEVLAHLGPAGISQSELTTRMGFTKQAVQQLIDQLAEDGVVHRLPDPHDKRAKRIELTELGLRDLAERNRVKRGIEDAYRQKLGDRRYKRLEKALRRLVAEEEA
jgi:DNA-binding MarR family transcriptional regulator